MGERARLIIRHDSTKTYVIWPKWMLELYQTNALASTLSQYHGRLLTPLETELDHWCIEFQSQRELVEFSLKYVD